jgi:OOP family OmpA-OmpF porin
MEMMLTPEQAEQNLMLNNPIPEQYKVFFKAGSAELDNTTRQILQETANNAIHLKPNKILINGNTDRTGPLQYNSELATKRANSVARFLIIMGVPENILDVRSYGESAAWADQAGT